MRIQSFCTVLAFLVWLLPVTVYATISQLKQEITISFDLDRAILHGNSILTLPADTPLQLYAGDLQQVTAKIDKDPLTPENKTIVVQPAPEERMITLSWQLQADKHGSTGNLITKKGITLTGFWHPMADRDMLFSLTAYLPRGFSGVTEAENLQTTRKKGKSVLKAAYPHPLRSINFAGGPFMIKSRKAGTTTVYTYFFKEDAGLAAAYLNRAVTYIKRYEKLLGPFPFKRYSIVENRLPTGYGMPTFTLLGQAVVRLPFIKDTSLGHEILHSWFGNSLMTDGTGNWCEGLTTYLADLSYAADAGKETEYRKNQLLRYQSYVHPDNITALIDFRHGSDSQPMAKKMRAIGYDKSSMVFHMLRREIGDDLFFNALRELYAQKKFTRIGWTDIETRFSETAGRDLSGFFGQWLLRRDVPNLDVQSMAVEQKEGKSELSFILIQNNEAPYRLRIPVVITTMNGESRKTLSVDSLREKVTVTVDSLPTKLVIDPDYDIMRSLGPAESYPNWMQFMGAEKKTVVLPDKKDMEIYMPLIAHFERSGCQLVTAVELKNKDLTRGSFVFLGNSRHTRGLFGDPKLPTKGCTVDVHRNPLSNDGVMVLVASASTRETTKIVRKLNHYGKYTYLHFENGRIVDKRTAPSVNGIIEPLLSPPSGMPVQNIRDFSAIVDDLAKSRVIYVGEMHTDYSSHILQLQIIQALHARSPDLMIGMEMFPRSSQAALDNFINGTVNDEREFIRNSRYFKVWGYDYRMYRDIIGYARAQKIPLIGLNLDKEIVSEVFKSGHTDTLSPEQLEEVAAERDLELPGYRKRLQAVHNMHGRRTDAGTGFSGFLQAQSMWDETMAESIVMALRDNPEKKMVVIAGTGHVYKDSAIPPRVARRMDVRQSVVAADNGVDRGLTRGKLLDYLMFTAPVELTPAGKIGIVLNEIKADAEKEIPAQVEIIQVSPHGKAGTAGIRPGDIILAIDGFPVTTVGDLKAGLMDKEPGDQVTLKLKRDDQVLEIKVELSNMDRAAMRMPPGHPKK
jgi:uncharacterized iron-regulated protein